MGLGGIFGNAGPQMAPAQRDESYRDYMEQMRQAMLRSSAMYGGWDLAEQAPAHNPEPEDKIRKRFADKRKAVEKQLAALEKEEEQAVAMSKPVVLFPNEPKLKAARQKVVGKYGGEAHFRPGTAQLHREDGPAWKGEYYWHGTKVPKNAVLDPEKIKPEQILKEENAEVARVMMERYGMEKFLLDANAEELDCYMDQFGAPVTLYEIQLGKIHSYYGGTSLVLHFLTMLNSTLEPDGTRKPYVLIVPATKEQAGKKDDPIARHFDRKCAKCAMAWTWGLVHAEYNPEKET